MLFLLVFEGMAAVTSTMPTNGQSQQLRIVGIRGLEGRAGKGVGPINLQDYYQQLKRQAFGPHGDNVPLSGTIVCVRIDVALDLIVNYKLTSKQHLKERENGNYVETEAWLAEDVVTLRIVGGQAKLPVLFYVRSKTGPVAWSPEYGVITRRAGTPQTSNPQPTGEPEQAQRGRRKPPTEQKINSVIAGRVDQANAVIEKLRGNGKAHLDRMPGLSKLRRRN